MLLLTFTAGPNRYAIDVTWVVELVPKVELRPVPHAPAYLSGFLGYRGSVIPVVDLGLLLGSEPCRSILNTRIILLRDHRGPSAGDRPTGPAASIGEPSAMTISRAIARTSMGLMAEQVSDLAYVQPAELLPAPVQLADAPYLAEVVKTDYGFIQMVDVTKLRASIQF